MSQNFDEIISREGSSCYKYDLREKLFGTDDVYPMWVADTEFRTPDFITEAIQKRLDHGIFGYTLLDEGYFNSIINWVKNQHGYQLKKEWIRYSPGVVPSLFMSVLAFTEPNDKVIVQTPVYFPFFSAVEDSNRKLVRNPLILKSGRYEMDFEDLKSKIDSETKMLILCSPHNPTGNVWKEEELREICELCIKHNIVIISDEIHADLVYNGHNHIPTASLSNEIANQTLTLMAPSKTFNIAGLNSSYIYSSNKQFIEKFSKYVEGLHIGPNIFAIEATKAAYNHGAKWVEELNAYYTKNINTVRSFLDSKLRNIDLIEPEGTFLLWMDFQKTGLSHKEVKNILIKDTKIGFSDGIMFGSEGEGFQRMNIGCPTAKIEEVLERLAKIERFVG